MSLARACHDVQGANVSCLLIFFFNDTATTEIYTLSLHDALPISIATWMSARSRSWPGAGSPISRGASSSKADRKSTRLNSSHDQISYAVFCLKKKKKSSTTHQFPYQITNAR